MKDTSGIGPTAFKHKPFHTSEKIILLFLITFPFPFFNTMAQFDWPKQCKAAVCLTYDDGLSNHLDIVIPQLDSFSFKGTFFIPGNAASLYHRMDEWRNIASSGHELGNHSLFHPCDWKTLGLGIKSDYDLAEYSYKRLITELQTANTLLKAIDGKDRRTFAYTCSQYTVEGNDFSDSLKQFFTAARGDGKIPEYMSGYNVFKAPSWCVGEPSSADDLIAFVNQARTLGTIAIFMFHDIGGKPGWFNLNASTHRKLLEYLKENETDYYIATFLEVMDFINSKKKNME